MDNTSKLTQVRQQIKDSWNNLDEEQKQQIITKRASTWNSSSVEHKKHKTQALKQTWETKDKQIFSQTIKLQKQQRSEQEKLTTSNKLRQMWNNRSAEDRNKIKCKIKSTWNNKTAQEKKIITDKFKNKLPKYYEKIANKKMEKISIWNARKRIKKAIEIFGITEVYAYNANFDYNIFVLIKQEDNDYFLKIKKSTIKTTKFK